MTEQRKNRRLSVLLSGTLKVADKEAFALVADLSNEGLLLHLTSNELHLKKGDTGACTFHLATGAVQAKFEVRWIHAATNELGVFLFDVDKEALARLERYAESLF